MKDRARARKQRLSHESGKAAYTRRDMLKAGGVLLASSLAGGIVKPASLMAEVSIPRTLNIGIFGPSHCAAPFVYTKLKGFFGAENLQVNLVNYPEMPLIAKDLISGRLDFGQLIVPLAFAIHTGSPPFPAKTPVVIPQIGGTNGAALMVRKGSGIQNVSDFKGKTIANHSKLSVHYLINMMFLEAQGLDYLQDVKFRVIELNEIVETMKNGEIDSFVMPEPKDAAVEQAGFGEIFMLSKYIWPNHPCCALVTRREFFEANRELATSVTRAFTRGGLLANDPSRREELIDLLASTSDYKYDKVAKPVLMSAFTPGRSDFYPFPFQSTARVIIEIMKKYSLLPQDIDDRELASEVFLSDLSRQVMKELGATPPEGNYRSEKILGKLKEYPI